MISGTFHEDGVTLLLSDLAAVAVVRVVGKTYFSKAIYDLLTAKIPRGHERLAEYCDGSEFRNQDFRSECHRERRHCTDNVL